MKLFHIPVLAALGGIALSGLVLAQSASDGIVSATFNETGAATDFMSTISSCR